MAKSKINSLSNFLVTFFVEYRATSRMLNDVLKNRNNRVFMKVLGLPSDFDLPFFQEKGKIQLMQSFNSEYEVILNGHQCSKRLIQSGDYFVFTNNINKKRIKVLFIATSDIQVGYKNYRLLNNMSIYIERASLNNVIHDTGDVSSEKNAVIQVDSNGNTFIESLKWSVGIYVNDCLAISQQLKPFDEVFIMGLSMIYMGDYIAVRNLKEESKLSFMISFSVNAVKIPINDTDRNKYLVNIKNDRVFSADSQTENKQKQSGYTIGETVPKSASEENSTDTTLLKTSGRVSRDVPLDKSEPNEYIPINKKLIGKFVYATPILIFLIGVIVLFYVVPSRNGKVESFVDWISSDPQSIMDTLHDSSAVLHKVYSDITIKIFWKFWHLGLIVSLFFVGKHLHAKPKPNGVNSILLKKEPYMMMQVVNDALKPLKSRASSKQLDSLLYSVKKLEEKFSAESDFGYGKSVIINCENDIARQIQFLVETVKNIEYNDFEKNLKAMNAAVININSLLRRRSVLKKR